MQAEPRRQRPGELPLPLSRSRSQRWKPPRETKTAKSRLPSAQRRPRPASDLLCGLVPQQLRRGCSRHLRPGAFSRNKVCSSECGSCGGGVGWGGGLCPDQRQTLADQGGAEPSFIQQPGWVGGWWCSEGGRKPSEVTLITSVRVQKSPRGGAYGPEHHLLTSRPRRSSLLPPATALLLSDWLLECGH